MSDKSSFPTCFTSSASSSPVPDAVIASNDDNKYVVIEALAGCGKTAFAAVERGNVHTYFDGTWTVRPAFVLDEGLQYTSISSSGDGKTLMASAENGHILLSNDYGDTTTPLTTVQEWQDVTLAADGLTGFAVAQNGFVYKYSAEGGILTNVLF